MQEQSKLTPKEQKAFRRWFTKIDENTIELKVKWKGFLNVVLITLALLPSLYYDFIKPRSAERFSREVLLSFQPEVYFEREYNKVISSADPNFTIYGESKEEYMSDMWQWRKNQIWDGYLEVAWYPVILALILWPTKRRIRFDRKRGIIYTYINKKFYLTEVNKLMRPLPEYFINTGALLFWIHPYTTQTRFKYFATGSKISIYDLSMVFYILVGRYIGLQGTSVLLKKYLVDFMNPSIDQDKLKSMMETLEAKKSPFICLLSFLFGWIEGGVYTKRLPKQEKLETMITKYFKEEAPKIRALPSCRLAYKEEIHIFWGAPLFKVISQDENRKAGFTKVPCPNLYEYPEVSIHRPRYLFDPEWGNVKGKEL